MIFNEYEAGIAKQEAVIRFCDDGQDGHIPHPLWWRRLGVPYLSNAMTNDLLNLPSSSTIARPVPARRTLRRLVGPLVIFVLAWLTITFLARDPLHYLIDQTPRSFGRFWPNRPWLLLHIMGGLAAILIGPFQFVSRIRTRLPAVHRWSGRLYVSGIVLAGATAFYLSFYAQEPGFGIALFAMAVVWWLVTGMAFVAIRQRRITVHRRWMIRSYILTFAFVTFRQIVTLPVWAPFGSYYVAAAAWGSWLLPLIIAELIFRRARRSQAGLIRSQRLDRTY